MRWVDQCGTVHYTSQGHIMQKVLNTKAVYESQTGLVVANEIESILEDLSSRKSCSCHSRQR